MLLKAFVFFVFLKFSTGLLECQDSSVGKKLFPLQCVQHDHYSSSDKSDQEYSGKAVIDEIDDENIKANHDQAYHEQNIDETVTSPSTIDVNNGDSTTKPSSARDKNESQAYEEELYVKEEETTAVYSITTDTYNTVNDCDVTKIQEYTSEISPIGVAEKLISLDNEYSSSEYKNERPNKVVSQSFNNRLSYVSDYEQDNCNSCDLRILPIQPLEHQEMKIKSNREMLDLPTTKIQFSDVPEGDKYYIESYGLSEGFFVFSYLREFISYIQPNEFPVGLLQDALQNQISIVSLVMESLQLEVGFVAVLAVGIVLALAVPCVVLSHTCYRMKNPNQKSQQSEMNESEDIVIGWAGNCRRRTLVFILQLLLLLLIAGMLVMFVTNEQLSTAMNESSKVLLTAVGDLKTFLHNSHLQLHFVVTRSLDQALQACYADLDNVGVLLGRPIQEELVRQTGFDVVLASLLELSEETSSVAKQVDTVLSDARDLQELLVKSRDNLADLRHQVDMVRRQCPPRDRALCDTLHATGLDMNLRLDRLRGDEKLNRLRMSGSADVTTALNDARSYFDSIPLKVESDTRDARQVVRRQLTRQRTILDEEVRSLEQFTRSLATKVNDAKYYLANWLQSIDEVEFWRWIVSGSAALSVLVIWSLLLSGISCGCCGSEKSVGPTLLGSILLMCLVSTALWVIALVGFLIGGHGEVFVCRPLYDEPQFTALTRLLDEPGVFYKENKHGFFSNVVYNNDSVDLSFKNILRECRDNKPTYRTFQLHRIFDVDSASDVSKWDTLRERMNGIHVDMSHLQLLTPSLNNQLYELLEGLSVNFTAHRTQLSGSVTGKDLNSFATQINSVGDQIRDSATASRMEALASKTRQLVTSDIHPLEEKRDSLIYQLTALEVQVQPMALKANLSLTQLKTIQLFINRQGEEIGNKKTGEYLERLNSYIRQFREHVLEMAQEKVAPCKPMWTIFHSTRLLFCKHMMDPMNGYWFATMWCLIVLLIATPVCLKLVDYYRLKGKSHSRNSGSPSESLIVAEHGRGWSTPGEGGDGGSW